MGGKLSLDRMLSFRLTDAEFRLLKQYADTRGIPLSKAIRTILRDEISKKYFAKVI